MSKEEFAAFAVKYMDTIYRVAYSWTRNPDDANDVTCDTFYQKQEKVKKDSITAALSFIIERTGLLLLSIVCLFFL